MSPGARAGLYVRVSTQDQNPEMQLRDLRSYAQARNLTPIEYIDHGISGSRESRPALDRLMNDARKRQVDVVLVWRFDRFARSTRHLLSALEEFRSLGVQFISFQENIDTTSPLGQAIFTIVSAVAQLERDIIRERVKAGMRNAIAPRGKKVGRPPAGITVDQVVALRNSGASWRTVGHKLGVDPATALRLYQRCEKGRVQAAVSA